LASSSGLRFSAAAMRLRTTFRSRSRQRTRSSVRDSKGEVASMVCSAIWFSSLVGAMPNRSRKSFTRAARTSFCSSMTLPKRLYLGPSASSSASRATVPSSRCTCRSPLMKARMGSPVSFARRYSASVMEGSPTSVPHWTPTMSRYTLQPSRASRQPSRAIAGDAGSSS